MADVLTKEQRHKNMKNIRIYNRMGGNQFKWHSKRK